MYSFIMKINVLLLRYIWVRSMLHWNILYCWCLYVFLRFRLHNALNREETIGWRLRNTDVKCVTRRSILQYLMSIASNMRMPLRIDDWQISLMISFGYPPYIRWLGHMVSEELYNAMYCARKSYDCDCVMPLLTKLTLWQKNIKELQIHVLGKIWKICMSARNHWPDPNVYYVMTCNRIATI